MAAKKTATTAASSLPDLEKHADEIRAALKVPKQNEVFRAAVEAGFLAALADGDVDAEERATILKAVEIISVGAVIEWEAETLLEQCAERMAMEGPAGRAEAVGKELKSLGQASAGLLMAAIVARATKGVDKKEAEVLKNVGSAAGLSTDEVRDIVKKAGSLA
jgi:tellurite resistance protein